ncbi:MAG TPA: hypothetical protein VGE97_11140 [Nitrososphaera sp.]|jgi:hypothetical protein
MSYLEQSAIAENPSMSKRVAQCAAQQHAENPDQWTAEHRRHWAASPGWDTAWASALAANPNNPSYDPGADEAVITDQMILSEVQSLIIPT